MITNRLMKSPAYKKLKFNDEGSAIKHDLQQNIINAVLIHSISRSYKDL